MARPRTRSQAALDAAELGGVQAQLAPRARKGGKVRVFLNAGNSIADSSGGPPPSPHLSCAPLRFCASHALTKTKTHTTPTQAAPPPLRSELPSMALLTLLYFIQGVPLGLTMGSV